MPANLNALIRYKTIDRLLGTGRKYTLSELIEHCSEALAEFRGIYRPVSKRTIQEDIRVLRSDILGFNAPIKNSSGRYYYTDPDFSIFEVRVSNFEILKRVYEFLFSLREDVKEDKIDLLLAELGEVIAVHETSEEITPEEDIAKTLDERIISDEDMSLDLPAPGSVEEEWKEVVQEGEFWWKRVGEVV